MVNTLAIFDVGSSRARSRLEAVLKDEGFVWLFPTARWSSRPPSDHNRLVARLRVALRGAPYRVVLIELSSNSRATAKWLLARKG